MILLPPDPQELGRIFPTLKIIGQNTFAEARTVDDVGIVDAPIIGW
jgi:hypothetical protein